MNSNGKAISEEATSTGKDVGKIWLWHNLVLDCSIVDKKVAMILGECWKPRIYRHSLKQPNT